MLRAQSHLDAPIPALLYTVFTVCSSVFFYFRSRVLTTHLQAILEVFLLCLAGYILAAKGILDKKTQKVCLVPVTSPQALTRLPGHISN